MSHGALQRQQGRQSVDVRRIALGLGRRGKAQVVVTVGHLCLPPGAHVVDLGGHLVGRAQPRFAGQGDQVIAVVLCKQGGVLQAQLFQRVPDPVVGAGGGEVIATGPTLALQRHEFEEAPGHGVHDRVIRHGVTQDHDARSGVPGLCPFGHHGPAFSVTAFVQGLPQRRAVVHGYALFDGDGTRNLAEVRGGLCQGDQCVEIDVGALQPTGGGVGGVHDQAVR